MNLLCRFKDKTAVIMHWQHSFAEEDKIQPIIELQQVLQCQHVVN